jgi:hypothetical protein
MLLLGAAAVLVAIVIALSPPLRLELHLWWDQIRSWLFNLTN